jgi:NAD(P)-dependent dehydrogenase (short-subunit alcohol dehydrogenase family)
MILVTGASGTNGRTLLRRLSALGAGVRAMVRQGVGRDNDLFRGVELAYADFDDAASISRALGGIESAFLVTNSSERAEEQQLRFVERASEAGVRRIVYISQLHAARNSPVRFLHYHAVVEQAISSSGMAFTHLRPNLAFRQSIQSDGSILAPVGDARVSIVDVRDIVDARRNGFAPHRCAWETDHVRGHSGNGNAKRVVEFWLSRMAGRWTRRGLRALSTWRSLRHLSCSPRRYRPSTWHIPGVCNRLQADVLAMIVLQLAVGSRGNRQLSG